MAIYDREERKLVVRIVYDGPVAAGKTTNLKQLCNFFTTKRRSELFVPEEIGGRTVFFDWLQIEACFVGGHPLRCQFVTVPGQTVLNARRRHLLGSADAIVFVCDSTPKGVRTAQDVLRSFRELRGAAGMPLVIQANKQDLPGAATPEELAARFGLDADVSIVAARADRGVGVRETAVLAIRSAANRVQRDLLLNGVDALAGAGDRKTSIRHARGGGPRRLSPAQTLLASRDHQSATPRSEGSFNAKRKSLRWRRKSLRFRTRTCLAGISGPLPRGETWFGWRLRRSLNGAGILSHSPAVVRAAASPMCSSIRPVPGV
jgi:signal recognition particle receptor subunit beta